ncbi:hypothetical protein AB32_5188 [Escherichia coli 2-316-03_S1_C2]|nr:hypothetical protein HMPREF1595_01163 [Escherichia coli 907672]EYE15518.1 hypothetical protein AC25_5196 [Escherichia coli 1-110-08_S3_C2]EYE15606.1 hypothetical protein AC55_0032 [Escherichia coli 1-110-08_S3_C3]KDA71002.1 hypothetical protein AC12_5123 [Escherichia coli 2-005-03_S3_C2]KEJ20450.1 hypothetical protein AB03_5233 [Escherichia coli 2-316-03_S1_C1]KEJ21106.1 hypothetical protein AB32_5188 [Escherichia coli 2-316-03_S1_C2]
MVPGDAVFPCTIISVTINWNANLKLISDAALVASRCIAPPVGRGHGIQQNVIPRFINATRRMTG